MAESPNNSTPRSRPLARPFMGPGKTGATPALARGVSAPRPGTGVFAPRRRTDEHAAVDAPPSNETTAVAEISPAAAAFLDTTSSSRDHSAASAVSAQLDAVLSPITESIEAVAAESGEVDELSLSPQSQWTKPSLDPLPVPDGGAAIEGDDASPSAGYMAPELSRWDSRSVDDESADTPMAAMEDGWAQVDSPAESSPEVQDQSVQSLDEAARAPEEGDLQDRVGRPESISAFDDLATVQPVAMLTALLADDREDPARERIASVLERLAARVRAGEISLGHSANVASETAVLASVLTTLLSEAL